MNIVPLISDAKVVNLGIGIPTLVTNFLPQDSEVMIQSEGGIVGCGPMATDENRDEDIVDAAGVPVTVVPGGAVFDSTSSFNLIRGGHLDCTVLGAMEVDMHGNIANWIVPGQTVAGMGGAMDLVVGAKKVIVAMRHCDRSGNPKILKNCSLPLTAKGVVTTIVTELGIMDVTKDGIVVKALAPDVTPEQICGCTEAPLIFAKDLKPMIVSL